MTAIPSPRGACRSVAARLLRTLRSGSALPSELLAALGVTNDALLHLTTHLESLGFDISRHPMLGYTLMEEPQYLTPEAVLSHIEGDWVPEVMALSTTTSTNTEAAERGLLEASGPLAIFAEHQTAGRGRLGRKWEAKAGEGLLVSILLRPNSPQATWTRITTLTALAVSEAIESVTGVYAGIKWPNDILVNSHKVAGILAETGTSPTRGAFLIVGIGLNVNQTDFPPELASKAAALRQILGGKVVNRAALAAKIIDRLGFWIERMEQGFELALKVVTLRSTVLGKQLTLHSGTMSATGTAEALDENGGLLLRLADGELRAFSAGEVSLRGA
jgi:BirA family biotin operon repressor/biotin-[acetyl-CoA-carboxylase] ligase